LFEYSLNDNMHYNTEPWSRQHLTVGIRGNNCTRGVHSLSCLAQIDFELN